MSAFRFALALCCVAVGAEGATRRLAVVVGNNAGGGARAPLRYAETDAGKMARVLVELGDVEPTDVLLLQGRGRADVEQAFSWVKEQVGTLTATPDMRALLVFFYSGHSDGEALELGKDRLRYSELKALLSSTRADMRVAIIDACQSGSAISEKGGALAGAFTIRLADELTTRGEAILTSSAADEAALESAEVKGSIFTHNLITGLRGAADVSGDKLVTLTEVYRYAYERTVSSTSATSAGPHHPAFDYRLSGQGELVLVSLAGLGALVTLPEGAEKWLVVDLLRDQVVAEVGRGSAPHLALAPGTYGVRALRGGRWVGTRIQLEKGQQKGLHWSELSAVETKAMATKGPLPQPSSARVLAFSFGSGKGVASDLKLLGLLRVAHEPSIGQGPTFAVHGTTGRGNGVLEHAVHARVGYQLAAARGAFRIGAALEGGPGHVWQFAGRDLNGSGLVLSVAPRANVRYSVNRSFSVSLEGELAVLGARVDGRLRPVVLPSVGVGAGFGL